MSFSPSSKYYQQESERLLFRAFEIEDIQRWAPFFIDNDTLHFVGLVESANSWPEEHAEKWIAKQVGRMRKETYGQLAVISKESNMFIGVGGIIARELDGAFELEITYSLLPSAWGKGYATELASHFKTYAFENSDIPSVISLIHTENTASRNVAVKNGMTLDGKSTYLNIPVHIYRAMR